MVCRLFFILEKEKTILVSGKRSVIFGSCSFLLPPQLLLLFLLFCASLLLFRNSLCVYLSFGGAYVLCIWYNRVGRRKRFSLQNNPIAERWRSCFSFILLFFFAQSLDNRYGLCHRKINSYPQLRKSAPICSILHSQFHLSSDNRFSIHVLFFFCLLWMCELCEMVESFSFEMLQRFHKYFC